jgi:xylulose-5-phosphate/fructose-6-phosphate phosphoketolase
MRRADQLAAQVEKRVKAGAPADEIERLRDEIVAQRGQGAERTNAELQEQFRAAALALAAKKGLALELDSVAQKVEALRAAEGSGSDPRLGVLVAEQRRLAAKVRGTLTPFIIYREAKGGGKAPAFIDGKPTKGAPVAHQLILQPADLESKDDGKARRVLERWLSDLTHGKGPGGLIPQDGSALQRSLAEILPGERMRPGGAPLATGRSSKQLERIPVADFAAPLKGARGSETRGGNELLDRYLSAYLAKNPESVVMFSADTAESNRLKVTVGTHGRHTNQKIGPDHPKNSGPRGRIIDVLSEQHLMAMAQGVANSGKQAIITNYEAFFQITSSMVKQYLKFRKQADEANRIAATEGNPAFRADVPNMVFHLSSLGFEQDHNGYSHQNFGFVNDLMTEPRRYVRVLMPAEANTAVLALDTAVTGTNKAVAVVADKSPRKQFLSPEEAKELIRVGAAEWSFASSVDGKAEKPDVVLAASGGYHTDEVLAAGRILKAWNGKLDKGDGQIRFTTVNVVEPLKLRAPEGHGDLVAERLRALDDAISPDKRAPDDTVFDGATFDRLFPAATPVIYNFGGAQHTAESLFTGRGRDVSAHGYRNEGSTTTRFDMMVRNGCDRFSLVIDTVERVYRAGKLTEQARDQIQRWARAQLHEHAARMQENASVDPPEIAEGIWK